MDFINWLYLHVNDNQVVVSTKSPRSDKQYVWEAVADSSSYVIREETDPEKLLRRGTQVTLYLKVSGISFIFLMGRRGVGCMCRHSCLRSTWNLDLAFNCFMHLSLHLMSN